MKQKKYYCPSHIKSEKIITFETWVSVSSVYDMQKTKWLSKEALQIAVKRREAKSKGEKKRYTHLNVEFQRIARRYKE